MHLWIPAPREIGLCVKFSLKITLHFLTLKEIKMEHLQGLKVPEGICGDLKMSCKNFLLGYER